MNFVAVRRKVRAASEKPRLVAITALARWTSTKVALGLLATSALLTTSRVAHAEMTLRWDAPSSCPQRDEVLERIRKLAGSSLDKTEGLSVEGSIERTSQGRYALTLFVRDEHDVRKRVITSDSCADLAGAAAVTLALLLGFDVSAALATTSPDGSSDGSNGSNDPNASQSSATDPTKAPANDTKNAPPKAVAPVKPKPHPPDDASNAERWGFLLRAPTAHADFGPLPHPALGLGAGAGVRYGVWRFVLAGHVSRNQNVESVEIPESGAELKRLTAELTACRGFRFSSVELAPCAALALEVVSARGFGDSVAAQSAKAVWPAVGIGGKAALYPWEPLAIFATVTGYVELSRPRLVIEGVGEIAELSPAAAFATLGVEWIF